MERALRGGVGVGVGDAPTSASATLAAPDVVRSTIAGAPARINDQTIDRLFCAPGKIVIPERYVPEQQTEEPGEDEKRRRLQKAESIRRMLTGSASVELPRRPPSMAGPAETAPMPPAEARQLLARERQQRHHFLGLNHFLVEELKEKSKMVAGTPFDRLLFLFFGWHVAPLSGRFRSNAACDQRPRRSFFLFVSLFFFRLLRGRFF